MMMITTRKSPLIKLLFIITTTYYLVLVNASSPSPTTLTKVKPSSSSSSSSSILVPAYYKLSKEQIKSFHKNGYIIIPNLLTGQELTNAIKAAHQVYNSKSILERLITKFTNFRVGYDAVQFQTWRKNKEMERIAFDSVLPSICAQLMGLDDGTTCSSTTSGNKSSSSISSMSSSSSSPPIRLLKDAFLGYAPGDEGCGWHVDDKTFWPCQDTTNYPYYKKDSGINVWIALSPLSKSEGGGLAISKGSHRATWREKVRSVIKGSNMLTCQLEKLNPKYHKMLERNMVLQDMKPGDAIIHDRYTFHRVVHFTNHDDIVSNNNREKNEEEEEERNTKFRISLRYMPANAIFQPDYSKKDSVIVEKDLKSGDPISKGEEYFPQVWPHSLVKERKSVVKNDAPLYSWKLFAILIKNRIS